MSIKYDDKLNQEIKRTVRNFNAKVRYNKTKTKGKGMLPRTISTQELKDKYSDKSLSELKKQLKLYQSFGSRNALNLTDGNRLSKWERNYFEKNRAKTKKFYQNEIADLERIIGDKPEYHMRLHNRLQTLKSQLKALDKDLGTLSEDQIKGFRGYYNYAERSEIVKRKGFRLYLSQLSRTMDEIGYSKEEIEGLLSKFDVLSENEFTEMVRNEDLIDAVYDLIDSPKKRGQYELMTDEKRAKRMVKDIFSQADDLVAKYKTTK